MDEGVVMKPILFNTEMVQAILDGRKTQTRRAVNTILLPNTKGFDKVDIRNNILYNTDGFELYITSNTEKSKDGLFGGYTSAYRNGGISSRTEQYIKPQYKKGDILYVRETFNTFGNITMENEVGVRYKADDKEIIYTYDNMGDYVCQYVFNDKWKPSIHMPKKYARIFLKVTDVRVERLHDIEDDTDNFLSEGYPISYELQDPRRYYSDDMHREVDYCEDCMIEWWEELWNSTSKDGYKWEDNPYVFVYEFERIQHE